MPIESLARRRRRTWVPLLVWALLAGGLPSARGQPPSAPAPANVDPNEPTTAERLRKLEEMNQALLQQFQGLAKQNAQLSKQNAALAGQVQDLSKRLDESSGTRKVKRTASGGPDPTAPTSSEDAARPSRDGAPGG